MKRNLVLVQREDRGWYRFENAVDVLETRNVREVSDILARVDAAIEKGLFAAGFLSYESAPGIDPALVTHKGGGLPLIWFGLYRQPEVLTTLPAGIGGFTVGKWMPSEPAAKFYKSIGRIRRLIRAGDTYQVNYTLRLRASFQGNPLDFFVSLHHSQCARYSAFVETDHFALCSASPELFFRIEGEHIVSKPMKGTRSRGRTTAEDYRQCKELAESEKDRAENVMIVDMVRNDLGRVARPGSVKVNDSFQIEKYPTVLQMVSTVRARTEARFSDILRAVFPCASITGAPKVRTMQIIRDIEQYPRGIYTGAIGWLSPPSGSGRHRGRRGLFNVAIRTAAIDKRRRMAEYGVGGGIVWDSDPRNEYRECKIKARVLSVTCPDFDLLETVLWRPSSGYYLLDRHISRLADSAEYFSFRFNRERIKSRLASAEKRFPRHRQKIRLLLSRAGRIGIHNMPLERTARRPLQLVLADRCVDSATPFLFHKTTNREIYDNARRLHPTADDVLLWNENGEVTETCIANLVVRLGNTLYTPPLTAGLLPGVLRGLLLKRGEIKERPIRIDELKQARELWLINSVRGWIPATLRASNKSPGSIRR